MAERPDADDIIDDESVDDAAAMRMLRSRLSWRDWILRDLLRYWYWLVALIVDVFVPWGIADFFHLWEDYRPIVVIGIFVVLFVVETYLYFFIWPEGPWKGRRRRSMRRRLARGSGIIDRLRGKDND